MSFASLAQPAIEPLIERFAEAGEVTLVVGAGASMEAGLPSWRQLIERLLRRVATANPRLTTRAAEQQWVDDILAHEDLLAAGAIVEAMATDDLDVLLPEELYGTQGPDQLEPGPIAREIARLHRCFGPRLTLLTTNYDDLIERALVQSGLPRKRVKSYVRRRQPPPETVAVTHLHGLAGRAGRPRRLVLTEEHYHRMQRGSSWQEQLALDRLSQSLCLFIGTTLTDPNLIRYLYGYQHERPGQGRAPSWPRGILLSRVQHDSRAVRDLTSAARSVPRRRYLLLMAARHGEVTRRLSGGWTLAWDSTEVDPALRKVTDEIVASRVESLQRLLGLLSDHPGADEPERRTASRSAA